MELKGVIFDLDGVVVDTVPMHYSAWQKLFKELGIKFNRAIYKRYVDGVPRIDGIRNIMPELDEKRLIELAERKQRYFLKELNETPPKTFTDAKYLIKELRSHGIKICIASSSKNCRAVLDKINLKGIDSIVDGNDIKDGKPNPEIFLKAADRIALKPKECLVIEDAVLGVKAARVAGMRCIYILRRGSCRMNKEYDWVVDNLRMSYEELVRKFRIRSSD